MDPLILYLSSTVNLVFCTFPQPIMPFEETFQAAICLRKIILLCLRITMSMRFCRTLIWAKWASTSCQEHQIDQSGWRKERNNNVHSQTESEDSRWGSREGLMATHQARKFNLRKKGPSLTNRNYCYCYVELKRVSNVLVKASESTLGTKLNRVCSLNHPSNMHAMSVAIVRFTHCWRV